MESNQIASLIYLTLLGAVIATSFFAANRKNCGKLAHYAAIWGLIFIGVIAAVGLWSDIRSTVLPQQAVYTADGRIEVPRGADGHYHLTLHISGTPVHFLVDTGATDVVLSRADARRLGIDPDTLAYYGQARTANGLVRTARVRLEDVRLGEIVDPRLNAWVNDGELDTSLLGMAYLQNFAKIEIERDRLILTR